MTRLLTFLIVVLTITALFLGTSTQASLDYGDITLTGQPTTTAPDCQVTTSGYFPNSAIRAGSLPITFTCSSARTIYFGVCDSGPKADDLYNIGYNGNVVASNSFSGNVENTVIGSATSLAGGNSAMLNILNTLGAATYSLAISPSRGVVANYLSTSCGADIGIPGEAPALGGCTKSVPVFTSDTAPSDGTLRYVVQYSSYSQFEGRTLREWNLSKGQRVNNDYVESPTPQYARLWWQPAGESGWHLLPSQYWTNSGTSSSEFGIACGGGSPSYHTAFSSAIAEWDLK